MKDASKPFSAAAWIANHPRLIIGMVLAACLGPFLNKAVYTDDALFVWAGQWIQKHPADFYGSQVNWWASDVPMWVANWNPPLLSYLYALVGGVFGWSEVVLHLVGLLTAFAACLGIYELARRWCARPLLATLIAIFAPSFLVSASTLMCDVLMLALWVWAVVFWERALAGGDRWWFVAAGLLAGLAVWSKYSAVTLLPLLPILTLLRTRRPGWWLAGLAVIVVMVAGYELLTAHMYGQGLLSAASYHARSFRPSYPGGWKAVAVIGFAFAGGGMLPVLFFAPFLHRSGNFWLGAAVVVAIWMAAYRWWDFLGLASNAASLRHWGYVLQVVLLAAGGGQLLLIAGAEAWRRRDVITSILLVWVVSVVFFAVVVNWLINARSFLPLVPAAAILVVRRLETMGGTFSGWKMVPLIPAAAVAVALVFADFQTAGAERKAARQIQVDYPTAGHQLWFVGHGAFQYYMQAQGALPVDATKSLLRPGDVVAMPVLGYGISTMPAEGVGWLGHVTFHPPSWFNLSGSTPDSAAGFYGANWGPIPFAVSAIPSQTFFVLKVLSRLQMDSVPVNIHGPRVDDVPSIPRISCEILDPWPGAGKPEAVPEIQLATQCQANGNTAGAIEHCRNALRIDPDNSAALNQLAWLLATAEDHRMRNGAEAVALAQRAVQVTDSRFPGSYSTLAAAYAEAGQMTQAVAAAKVAISLAHIIGQDDVALKAAGMLQLYQAGKTLDRPGT